MEKIIVPQKRVVRKFTYFASGSHGALGSCETHPCFACHAQGVKTEASATS